MICGTLSTIMHKENLNCEDISEMSGVPIDTVKNIYYGKVRNPKASTVLKISKALEVSVNYLMGDGFLNDDEQEILLNYRKCGKHGKSIITLVSRYEVDKMVRELNASEKHTIPCVIPIKDEDDGFDCINSEVVEIETAVDQAYLAVEIVSNAFVPVFCKNDKVLFADRFPRSGEKALFLKDGICYLRKYIEEDYRYILQPLTGHGKPTVCRRLDKYECVGTYIGVLSI